LGAWLLISVDGNAIKPCGSAYLLVGGGGCGPVVTTTLTRRLPTRALRVLVLVLLGTVICSISLFKLCRALA
jgi:hypothetical protein